MKIKITFKRKTRFILWRNRGVNESRRIRMIKIAIKLN